MSAAAPVTAATAPVCLSRFRRGNLHCEPPVMFTFTELETTETNTRKPITTYRIRTPGPCTVCALSANETFCVFSSRTGVSVGFSCRTLQACLPAVNPAHQKNGGPSGRTPACGPTVPHSRYVEPIELVCVLCADANSSQHRRNVCHSAVDRLWIEQQIENRAGALDSGVQLSDRFVRC